METTPVLYKPIYHPEIEVYLTNLENELNDFADLQGKEDGKKETEPSEMIHKITVTDPVHNKIQLGIDHVRKTLLSTSMILGAAENEKSSQEKITSNKNEANDKLHKLASIKRKMATLVSDPQKRKFAKWLIVVALFVGAGDGALAYGSFRHGSYTALQAFLAGIAIGAVISLSHLLYAGWIKLAATLKQKRVRIFIILAVAFAFFAWIGNLRASASNDTVNIAIDGNNVSAASTPVLNGWAVAIISFVLFVAVFFLSLLFWRSKKERMDEQEYKRLQMEAGIINTEIKTLETENSTIGCTSLIQKQEARQVFDYAVSSIRRAKSIGVNTITTYIQVYARFHNNVLPHFFGNPDNVVYDESFHFPKSQNPEQV